jgi:CheY-like chemotaxis protein
MAYPGAGPGRTARDEQRPAPAAFHVVPLAEALEPEAEGDSPELRPLLLVADDDPAVRRAVARVVRELGCDVLEAADGDEAVALARENRPDVVLLDAVLPGVHGVDVCRALKRDPELADCHVILCSPAYHGDTADGARQAFGADVALAKPFRAEDLRRAVCRALYGDAAERPGAEAAERSWRAAAEALQGGDVGEAERLARDAVALDPSSAEAHYYLGHALARIGARYEALAAFEQAASLRPDLALLHECHAEICEALGFVRAARAAWVRAAAAAEDPVRRHVFEGRLARLAPR